MNLLRSSSRFGKSAHTGLVTMHLGEQGEVDGTSQDTHREPLNTQTLLSSDAVQKLLGLGRTQGSVVSAHAVSGKGEGLSAPTQMLRAQTHNRVVLIMIQDGNSCTITQWEHPDKPGEYGSFVTNLSVSLRDDETVPALSIHAPKDNPNGLDPNPFFRTQPDVTYLETLGVFVDELAEMGYPVHSSPETGGGN